MDTKIKNEEHMKSVNEAIKNIAKEYNFKHDLTTELQLSASVLKMLTSFSINDSNQEGFIAFYYDDTNQLTDNANLAKKVDQYDNIIQNVETVQKDASLVKDKVSNIPFEQVKNTCERLFTITEVNYPEIGLDITKDNTYEDLAKDIITFAELLNCGIFEAEKAES